MKRIIALIILLSGTNAKGQNITIEPWGPAFPG